MIEQEIIKQYPSLVARPYLLIKDDLQRKDMQRFWFENTISFLAVLSGAELIRFYKDLKSKEKPNDKDFETIQKLQEHKSLTTVGLEHMSLGKWVMMLRETTKTLKTFQELNGANVVSELVEFYQGKNGKNNAKIIDKLVSIRNDDAHGNPIPEDKLNAELDTRQKLIDSLLDELTFLKNYQLVLPEKLEIEGSKQFYICKHFVGSSIVSTKETFDFSPQLSEVMLMNDAKKDVRLSLSPLLLYLGIQDEENNFLGIFSKYDSKDGKEAKYLNLDGSATIDLVNFGQDQELDLVAQRQAYNEIYSDPESFQVNLEITMKLEEEIIKINDESHFSLIIENKKSTDIENMRIILDIPKHIDVVQPKENDKYKVSILDKQLAIEFDLFEDNSTVVIDDIAFTVSEQGSYNFDRGEVYYYYYRTLADRDSESLSDEDMQFEGSSIEVRDPNSRDRMMPAINIQKSFVDVDGKSIQNVKIGEDFVFKMHVSNIGFSSAKNVVIDLLFPNHINLKQGKETIKLGQLNPFEERTFKYVLSSMVPEIYTIGMQNILYSDSQGARYATKCAEDHFIVVRSDLIKEFIYNVKEHIKDLYIDEKEKTNIESMITNLNVSPNVDAEEVYKEAETEAVIKIVRDLVEKLAMRNELKVVEKVYVENKNDAKITNSEQRKLLVFSVKDMPFFAINLSKGYEPEFFALKTNINNSFEKVQIKQVVVDRGSYTLDHYLDFGMIKYDEKYTMKFFSRWLNIILTRFKKEYLTWKELNTHIMGIYGINLKYVSGMFNAYPYESVESGVRESGIMTFLDRNNSQSYFVSLEVKSTKNYQYMMREKMSNDPSISFLTGTKEKTRLYDSKNLSYYFMQKDDTSRLTGLPVINYKIKDDKSMEIMLEKTKALWNDLCFVHSLDLLDSENFEEQKFLDEIKIFITKLYEKGFALRQNAKSKDMLDIYSLNHFKPHTATERDCIGFIKKHHKTNWQIFMDFFVDDINEILLDELTLINATTISDKVRWIKMEIQTKDQLDLVTEAILKQAEFFEPKKLAIWPKKLQKMMILNHGQTDSAFLFILKDLLSGVESYAAIKENLKSMQIDKELDRTLQRLEQFETEAGYESPLYVRGSDDNKTIGYKLFLDTTLNEMFEEDPKFDYMKEGAALFRIRTRQVVQKYDRLAKGTPYNGGMIDVSYKTEQYSKMCYFTLYPKSNTFEFALIFQGTDSIEEEKIKDTYSILYENIINDLIFARSGTKQQHVKISYFYSFEDYELELPKLQDFCLEFYTIGERGIDMMNENYKV